MRLVIASICSLGLLITAIILFQSGGETEAVLGVIAILGAVFSALIGSRRD